MAPFLPTLRRMLDDTKLTEFVEWTPNGFRLKECQIEGSRFDAWLRANKGYWNCALSLKRTLIDYGFKYERGTGTFCHAVFRRDRPELDHTLHRCAQKGCQHVSGCDKQAQHGGLCVAHGGAHRCRHPSGCAKLAKKRGLCHRHASAQDDVSTISDASSTQEEPAQASKRLKQDEAAIVVREASYHALMRMGRFTPNEVAHITQAVHKAVTRAFQAPPAS
jgi:hypothetical protein